jgi:hypothetical protein
MMADSRADLSAATMGDCWVDLWAVMTAPRKVGLLADQTAATMVLSLVEKLVERKARQKVAL